MDWCDLELKLAVDQAFVVEPSNPRYMEIEKFAHPPTAHPAKAVPAQAVQITLNGDQLVDALHLANPSLDFASMELVTDIRCEQHPCDGL